MKARYLALAPMVAWKERSRPLDWSTEFGRQARLEVEIGFGNGEYLVRRAASHPELNLVGIELTWGSLRRTLRKLHQEQVGNARLLWEDARAALAFAFAPASIDRVYALFPCPWPKKRHAKNRLFRHQFLQLVNSRLRPDGSLTVVTDHAVYRDEIVDEAPGGGFAATVTAIGPEHHTKYERKWQEGGQVEFYRLDLTKTEHFEINAPQEVTLERLRCPSFAPERYQPDDLHGSMTVEFKSFVYDASAERGLQEVITVEDEFTQHFWIEIRRKKDQWWVAPAPGCQVVPLASVQMALDRVAKAMVP
ncbi:MAG: tRNA (guanosine(46)-N(7))-methyltransferase TrmB [Vulcanimicrobiota bacterium]